MSKKKAILNAKELVSMYQEGYLDGWMESRQSKGSRAVIWAKIGKKCKKAIEAKLNMQEAK